MIWGGIRVPAQLQPNYIWSLLTQVCPVGRIWLRVEDTSTRTNTLASVNKNKDKKNHAGQHFQDTWVEFKRLRDVHRAVALLNGHHMYTCKRKKRKFSNELRYMKLLRSFTWANINREVFCSTQRECILKVREQIEPTRREKKNGLKAGSTSASKSVRKEITK